MNLEIEGALERARKQLGIQKEKSLLRDWATALNGIREGADIGGMNGGRRGS